jgi:hypothetical protein
MFLMPEMTVYLRAERDNAWLRRAVLKIVVLLCGNKWRAGGILKFNKKMPVHS